MLLSDENELLSSLLYIVSQYSFVPNLHSPSLLIFDACSLIVAIVNLCLLFLPVWQLFAHSQCLREIDVGWKVNEETKGSNNSEYVNMDDKIMLLLDLCSALSGGGGSRTTYCILSKAAAKAFLQLMCQDVRFRGDTTNNKGDEDQRLCK